MKRVSPALAAAAGLAVATQLPVPMLMWAAFAIAWTGFCWVTVSFPVTMAAMTPSRMMGKFSAIYTVLMGFFGGGLGATRVALVSDHWFSRPAALGNGMSIAGGSMIAINALSQPDNRIEQSSDKKGGYRIRQPGQS